MSRGKITFVAVTLAIALFSYYLFRDLNLAKNILDGNLPDVVVERLDFARVIKGREWRVRAASAESEGASGTIRARSMDVSVLEAKTGRASRVYAAEGEYSTKTDKMWLRRVSGTAFLSDRSVDFAAPRADYDVSSDVWYFADGISASDGSVSVTGGTARIDPDGILNVGKGARVRWKIE